MVDFGDSRGRTDYGHRRKMAAVVLASAALVAASCDTPSPSSPGCPTTTTTIKPTTTVKPTTTIHPVTTTIVPTTTAPAGSNTPTVTSQNLRDNTHLMHENGHYPYTAPGWGSYGGPSFSYVATHEYTQTPGPTDWSTDWGGALAGMHPWYELTTEENSPTNLDAKVEIHRIGLAVHSKSSNKWIRLYESGVAVPQAFSWDNGYDYLPDVKTSAGDRVMGLGLGRFAQPVYEPSLGGNGRLRAHGWSEAGWDAGRNYFHNSHAVAIDVDAVVSWLTIRVTGPDAAISKYRVMPGFDIMRPGTDVPSPPVGAWSGMQGRARVVRPSWQTFTVSTMSDAMIASLPAPPIPGYAG